MQEMRVYLLNNTKPYREGDEEYSGAWFNCPVDFEEIREKIGVEHEEQIEIADYELPFDLHSDTQLWEINANCRMVLELEGTPVGNEMKAIQQKWFSSFDEFIDHKDEIHYYDVGDGATLAEYLIREALQFRYFVAKHHTSSFRYLPMCFDLRPDVAFAASRRLRNSSKLP